MWVEMTPKWSELYLKQHEKQNEKRDLISYAARTTPYNPTQQLFNSPVRSASLYIPLGRGIAQSNNISEKKKFRILTGGQI